MGRTKRKRKRKRKSVSGKSLDHENVVVNLCKWMKRSGWENQTALSLREFETTGRGVASRKNVCPGDSLIQVPFKLLVTINTIQKSGLLDIIDLHEETRLKFQDLLILFLIVEKLKGLDSKWCTYIESLPQEPPWLPFELSQEDIESLPSNICEAASRSQQNVEESWKRLKKSINCRNGYQHCVLDVNLFTWAFIVVNTRAVYVDPEIIHDLLEFPDKDLRRFLYDKPCMALCPYLDMFNHSCDAKTAATLKKGHDGWFYELKTLRGYGRYEQIFISYGAHDNLTLLCEYGFFIPWKNTLDAIKFSIDEVLNILALQISSKRMSFLLERNLDKDLYIGFEGISFNLKGLFYFLLQSDQNIWSTCVFNESYPVNALEQFQLFSKEILQNRLICAKSSLRNLQSKKKYKNTLLLDYLKYYVELILYLSKQYEK